MNPFELPFMRTALAASLLGGTALSLLGAFVLLRRVSFAGLAVSQLAALGTVAGVVLGLHFGAFGVALAFVLLGLALLGRFFRLRHIPQDAWVAALYVLGAGASVLILSKAPNGEAHTMDVFFGNILALGAAEIAEAAVLFALVAAVLGGWFHRWVWISFDEASARVAGVRVGLWNVLFLALFAAAMTVTIHLFGVLLAFSYLLLPAVTGLLATRGMKALFVFTPVYTIIITVACFYVSFRGDFPTGPFVASTLAAAALLMGIIRGMTSPRR
jgi:ABC-type Mn2+/Zn2+ transport system permease subunit